MQKLRINTFTKNGFEYRTYTYQGLVCPNPIEYYKMTRSYNDLRAEYDLLNCYKLDETDLMHLKLKIAKVSVYQKNNFIIMAIIQALILLSTIYLIF